MLKYRFYCDDKENMISKFKQMKENDLPCGNNLFGGNLYGEGIHFRKIGNIVTGFYLADNENESHRGAPIRVSFIGKFTEDNDGVYFIVYVFPRIPQILFFLLVMIELCALGKLVGAFIALIVAIVFGKGYSYMIKGTYDEFKKII